MFYKNKLFKNISWIKETDLCDILHNQQLHLDIEKQYRFSLQDENEDAHITKILNLFIKDVIDDYFNKRLTMDFKLWGLNELEYFMYIFRYFLLSNELENYGIFLREYSIEMYEEELVNDKSYTHRDYIYNLTDFTITYHKLLLTVQTYCENNIHIQKCIPYLNNFTHSTQIKEILTTGKIEVMVR